MHIYTHSHIHTSEYTYITGRRTSRGHIPGPATLPAGSPGRRGVRLYSMV